MKTRHQALDGFGRNVKRLREARRFTQEKLAEKAGLDPTYISGIEREVRNPSILSIGRIAKALGTHSGDLFEGMKGRSETRVAKLHEEGSGHRAPSRFMDLFSCIGWHTVFEAGGLTLGCLSINRRNAASAKKIRCRIQQSGIAGRIY